MKSISKIINIIKILGLGRLLSILPHHLKTRTKCGNYINYPLDYSTLNSISILAFVRKNKVDNRDLVVVPLIHKNEIVKHLESRVISVEDENLKELDFSNYVRLIWATDRTDRDVKVAKHFYENKKNVIVMQNTGPSRVWMHDQVKEKILKEEYETQTYEGIEKFADGIGADFGNLLQVVDNVREIEGDIVEIGCFMGSSTCVLANYLNIENINKHFFVYDYFEGFTYEEAKSSIDNSWAESHQTDGPDAVKSRVLKRLKNDKQLSVIQRNIIEKDALREVDKIAFANIDVDLYEAIYSALHHVHPKISRNGIIAVEDAGHTPWLIGAKLALQNFISEIGRNSYTILQMESGQYLLIKR